MSMSCSRSRCSSHTVQLHILGIVAAGSRAERSNFSLTVRKSLNSGRERCRLSFFIWMGKISLDFAQDVLSVIIKITKGDGIYVVWQYWHHIMTLYQGVDGGVVTDRQT
jgi:hypothetical protein